MQTFGSTSRTKLVNTDIKVKFPENHWPPGVVDVDANVSSWDIYDAFAAAGFDDADKDGEAVLLTTAAADPAEALSDPSIETKLADGSMAVAKSAVALASLPAFRQALQIVEEAVIQNTLHGRHLLFREHPHAVALEDADTGAGPDAIDSAGGAGAEGPDGSLPLPGPRKYLIPLWSYGCELTRNLPVTCLCWNKKNTDLLAAGYGKTSFGNTSAGLVLFWTLKNPSFPQRVIHTSRSVVSLDFSTEYPHLLAAGLYDGSVCVYDIRQQGTKPDLQSQNSTGQHSEPVEVGGSASLSDAVSAGVGAEVGRPRQRAAGSDG